MQRLFQRGSHQASQCANVLALGARVVGTGLAIKIIDTFLETQFSGIDRHKRRVDMIEE